MLMQTILRKGRILKERQSKSIILSNPASSLPSGYCIYAFYSPKEIINLMVFSTTRNYLEISSWNGPVFVLFCFFT